MSEGATKLDACRQLGINQRTPLRWADRDPEFAVRYAAARVAQAHALAERALEIANEVVAPGDMAAIQRNRLRVDTLKWFCSKIAPRLYGDRVFGEIQIASGVVVLPPLDPDPRTSPNVRARDEGPRFVGEEIVGGPKLLPGPDK